MKRILRKFYNEPINTGERPVLETQFEEIDPVLQFAYKFGAKKIENDDSVLDYGCGGGYGTEYLSRFTSGDTTGFDIDTRVIKINTFYYKDKKNLKFTFSGNDLKSYDIITSFQVIEHLERNQVDDYLDRIKHSLKNEGVFLLATVNKNITSCGLKYPVMPFHVYEYGPWELATLLKKHFSKVSCYGQIDKDCLKKIKEEGWSYRKKDKNLKGEILNFISQFKFVRFVAKHLPVSFKQLFFGNRNTVGKNAKIEYVLVSEKNEIESSYITIYECENQ